MTTTGLKLTLDVGDAVSAAGRYSVALHHINEEVQKAEQLAKKTNKPEDWDRFAKLTFDRDRMQNSSSSFDRSLKTLANSPKFQTQGPNGQTVFKADPEFVSIMKTHVDAIKKLTTAYEAAAPGSDEATDLAFQIESQQKAFSKAIENATGTGLGKQGGGMESVVKSIFAQQIVGAIKSGLDVWVSSIDRTAVINSIGNGDMLGANLAESQRRNNLTRGVLETTGAAAQGMGMALAPFTGGISLVVGTAVNLLTSVFSSLTAAEQARLANRVAYSSLWDDKKDQALNLSAVMGDPSKVRETWGLAAHTAERFGFSADEGAEALKAAAMQGLGVNAVQQVFDYERRTGADRGALSSVGYMSERYGGGDALKAGWQALNASGMSTAQYGEFLRGIQRAMEDGINKGWVRSSDEVARNLTLLSQMTNGNPLWEGEAGAQRLMKMYGGFENSTGMQDSTDILAFRAARGILERKGEGTDYVDVMKYLENPENFTELFNEFRSLISSVEAGDRGAIVEHFRKQFGMTYHEADALREGGTFTSTQIEAIKNRQRGLPEAGEEITELKANIDTMRIQNLIIETGQEFWDSEIWKAIDALRNQYEEVSGYLTPGGGHGNPDDTPSPIGMPPVPYTPHERTQEIERMITMTVPAYFGDGQQDRTAREGIEQIFDSARLGVDEDQIQAAFNALSILNSLPDTLTERWNTNDTVNQLSTSGNATELLAALKELVEIERQNTEININLDNY